MRVALADDSALFRQGLALLLQGNGVEVVAQATTGEALEPLVGQHRPDAVILDIRMPPTFTEEGLETALRLRSTFPDLGILLLSTYADSGYAARLIAHSPRGLGYLVKDRVDDTAVLHDALIRLVKGERVLDQQIAASLLTRRRRLLDMERLTEREREVLQLMAEGRSNAGIAGRLFLSAKTVDTHIASVFAKLGLPPASDDNRRVLAVLSWLRTGSDSR